MLLRPQAAEVKAVALMVAVAFLSPSSLLEPMPMVVPVPMPMSVQPRIPRVLLVLQVATAAAALMTLLPCVFRAVLLHRTGFGRLMVSPRSRWCRPGEADRGSVQAVLHRSAIVMASPAC